MSIETGYMQEEICHVKIEESRQSFEPSIEIEFLDGQFKDKVVTIPFREFK